MLVCYRFYFGWTSSVVWFSSTGLCSWHSHLSLNMSNDKLKKIFFWKKKNFLPKSCVDNRYWIPTVTYLFILMLGGMLFTCNIGTTKGERERELVTCWSYWIKQRKDMGTENRLVWKWSMRKGEQAHFLDFLKVSEIQCLIFQTCKNVWVFNR